MKTLAIIPARAGSKRLPRKNVLPLAGKPLIGWVIEAALKAKSLNRIVVSSDDDEVLQLASDYASRFPLHRPPPTDAPPTDAPPPTHRPPPTASLLPLRRPAELATDTSLAIEYVRHALTSLEGAGEGPFDAVVILQPSSPLTLPEDIDGTVRLLESSGADTAVSVVKLDHAVHPLKLKVLQGDRLLPFLEEERGRMAAHELPELYVRNCAVYATRRHVIESGHTIGSDCRGYLMPRTRSLDINDELDLRFAEFLSLPDRT